MTLAIEPNMERAKGFEPLPETWRVPILPVELHPHDGFTELPGSEQSPICLSA